MRKIKRGTKKRGNNKWEEGKHGRMSKWRRRDGRKEEKMDKPHWFTTCAIIGTNVPITAICRTRENMQTWNSRGEGIGDIESESPAWAGSSQDGMNEFVLGMWNVDWFQPSIDCVPATFPPSPSLFIIISSSLLSSWISLPLLSSIFLLGSFFLTSSANAMQSGDVFGPPPRHHSAIITTPNSEKQQTEGKERTGRRTEGKEESLVHLLVSFSGYSSSVAQSCLVWPHRSIHRAGSKAVRNCRRKATATMGAAWLSKRRRGERAEDDDDDAEEEEGDRRWTRPWERRKAKRRVSRAQRIDASGRKNGFCPNMTKEGSLHISIISSSLVLSYLCCSN